MNYYIKTYQNEKQLLGSDFTKIVKNCKNETKLINAINLHKSTLRTLLNIKSFLENGYTIKVQKF
jgi:outer membrane phospholipase A